VKKPLPFLVSLFACAAGFHSKAAFSATISSQDANLMKKESAVEMSASGYSYSPSRKTVGSRQQEWAFRFALPSGCILRAAISQNMDYSQQKKSNLKGNSNSRVAVQQGSISVGAMSPHGFEFGALLAISLDISSHKIKNGMTLKDKSEKTFFGGYVVTEQRVNENAIAELGAHIGALKSKLQEKAVDRESDGLHLGVSYGLRADIYTPVAKRLLAGAGASLRATQTSNAQSLAWQVNVASLRWKF
jgi:hypothetical protein